MPEPAAPEQLDLRVEPRGPAAERTIARLGATGVAERDLEADAGAPAATAACESGEAAIGALVAAAEASLDDVDLKLTLRRR